MILSDPGIFSIAAAPYNAVPGVDCRAAIQAAIQAASAYAGSLGSGGSATVYIPQATYPVSGPLYRDCANVTIQGGGPGSQLVGSNYNGAIIVDGVLRLSSGAASNHRPAASALDGTASAGRTALATLGTHALVIAQHALTHGWVANSSTCVSDFYQGSQYTFEFLIKRPTSVTWSANAILGMFDGIKGQPWALAVSNSGSVSGGWKWLMQLSDGTAIEIDIAAAGGTGPWGLAIGVDLAAGVVTAWVNGTKVSTTGSLPSSSHLMAPSGTYPFVLGGGAVPDLITPGITPAYQGVNVELHGMMISHGLKYISADSTQTRTDSTAVNDLTRYFTPTANTIAYFLLQDAAATEVKVESPVGGGIGVWLDVARTSTPSGNLALANLTITSGCQAAVLQGNVWGTTYANCVLGSQNSWNGIASLRLLGYPTVVDTCTLFGADSGLSFYHTDAYVSNCTFKYPGRTAVQFSGGLLVLDRCFTTDVNTFTRSLIDLAADSYGAFYRITDFQIDNEASSPLDASIHFRQCANTDNYFLVDGLLVAQPGAKGSIWMEGFGNSNQFPPAKVEIKNITAATTEIPAIKIDGSTVWLYGSIDLSSQPVGSLPGTTYNGTAPTTGPLVVIPPAYPA